MEASREELTLSMQNMSNDELLRHLGSGALTPLGVEVASTLLRARGIEPSAPSTRPDTSSNDTDEESELVTVAEYLSTTEAGLLRGCLESRGIYVHVWGEYVEGAQVVLPTAQGGAHLQVPRNQVEQAQAVIAAVERGDFEIPAAS